MTYNRRKVQCNNSTTHAERAVGALRGYYQHMHGRGPCSGRGVDFTHSLTGVMRGLRNLYLSTTIARVLLIDDMRAIRTVMKMDNLRDFTYCALWKSQWQGVMRSSDILLPSTEKARKREQARDTHLERRKWEDVDPAQNGGCKRVFVSTSKQVRKTKVAKKGSTIPPSSMVTA